MAYVTVEDDTASIEMLAFSKVINEHGSYLRENSPVIVTGRLSVREDKDPQILINRARPITDVTEGYRPLEEVLPKAPLQTLYLKVDHPESKLFRKIRAILQMFPGDSPTVVYFADIKKQSRGTCALEQDMLSELKNVLGEGNVVLK